MPSCKWRAYTKNGRIIELGRRTETPTVFSDSFCSGLGYSRAVGFPGSPEGAGKNCITNDDQLIRFESYDCLNGKYDCINGTCVDSATYATAGIYASLSDCQAKCGAVTNTCPSPNVCVDPDSYCPPGKVCVPIAEYSQIESLANQLKNKSCS